MNKIGKKIDIKSLTLSELKDEVEKLGDKKFRAEQIFNWIYNNLLFDFNEMENIPKSFRNILNDNFSLATLKLVTVQDSDFTRTRKYLYETHDGKKIETVLIPDGERNTLCISTQVGCPLDCKFCATGLMGYTRNLTTGEIVDQYLLAAKEQGKDKITNIVFMGMGEPLLNFENTFRALDVFTNKYNKGLSRNRITVSTSGIPHKIKELAERGIRVKLALSLHSCFEDIRAKIMPISNKYTLEANMEAIREYTRATKTRITFEYTMLKGVNDRDEDIKALGKLCGTVPSKINIIPFNSIAHMDPDGFSGTLEPTAKEDIELFAQKLRDKNITVMLRDTQGSDIAAACGQLAVKHS